MSQLDFDTVLDSRDVIKRLEELKELVESSQADRDDQEEFELLCHIKEECENYSDWEHGQSIINYEYFTEYIKQIIEDCYETPEGLNKWPWNCIDWEDFYGNAAEEAEVDYHEFDTDSGTYLVWAH